MIEFSVLSGDVKYSIQARTCSHLNCKIWFAKCVDSHGARCRRAVKGNVNLGVRAHSRVGWTPAVTLLCRTIVHLCRIFLSHDF